MTTLTLYSRQPSGYRQGRALVQGIAIWVTLWDSDPDRTYCQVWIGDSALPDHGSLCSCATSRPEVCEAVAKAMDRRGPMPVELLLDRLVDLVGESYPRLCEAVGRIVLEVDDPVPF